MTEQQPVAITEHRWAKWHRYRMSGVTWCGRNAAFMGIRSDLGAIPASSLCRICWKDRGR